MPQQDDDGRNMRARRGAFMSQATSRYDYDPAADYAEVASVSNSYSFNDYFQKTATSTTRYRFDHTAANGAPQFNDVLASNPAVTQTTEWIYAWQVYDELAGQNRLSEVYATVDTVSEDQGPTYVKGAGAHTYAMVDTPVGAQTLLVDRDYDLKQAEEWVSVDAMLAKYPPAELASSDAWLGGETIVTRDSLVLDPTSSQATSGEVSFSLVSYEAADVLQSYPARSKYASFTLSQMDSVQSVPLAATYVGFEEYEDVAFDAQGSASSPVCTPTTRGLTLSGGHLVSAGGNIDTANTGQAYCSNTSLDDLRHNLRSGSVLSASLSSDFSPLMGTDYVVSAWVRPEAGESCSLSVTGTTTRNSTSTYDGYPADGKRWFYLESTIDADMVLPGELLSCAGDVDDIRVSPAGSGFRAQVLDTDITSPTYLAPIAQHSETGVIGRIFYDRYGRMTYTVSQDIDVPQSAPGEAATAGSGGFEAGSNVYSLTGMQNIGGLSRWNGFDREGYGSENEAFVPSAPNASYQVSGIRGYNTTTFAAQLQAGDAAALPSTDSFMARFSLDENNREGMRLAWGTSNSSDDAVATLAIDTSSGSSTVLSYQDLLGGGSQETLATLPKSAEDIVLLVHGISGTASSDTSSIALFVDGNLVVSRFQSTTGATNTTSDAHVFFTGGTGGVELARNLVIGPAAGGMNASFSDAIGSVVENHSLDGFTDASGDRFFFTDLVQSSYRDGWGNNAIDSKMVEYTSPLDAAVLPAGRSYQPQGESGPGLLQFRGAQSSSAGMTGTIGKFGAVDWSTYALSTVPNILSFERALVPSVGEALTWQPVAYAIAADAMSNPIEIDFDGGYYVRRISLNGSSNLDQFSGNGTLVRGGTEYCLLRENSTDASSSACRSNAPEALTPGNADFIELLAYSTGDTLVRVDSTDTLRLYGLQDRAVDLSSSELYGYYSGGNPGQALLGNSDVDARFALTSTRSAESPSARALSTTILPGQQYAQPSANGNGTDLTKGSFYQADPLGVLSTIGLVTANQASVQAGIRYSGGSQTLPAGNDSDQLAINDMFGSPMVATTSWSYSGGEEKQQIFAGAVYDLLKEFSVSNIDGSKTSLVGDYDEKRTPEWYQNDTHSGMDFAQSGMNYLLTGQWVSTQGSESSETHFFADDSGKGRITVIAPQFGDDFSDPGANQIAGYTKFDEYSRPLENGRLKNVHYGAAGWLGIATDPELDSSDLLRDQSCTMRKMVYDSYNDLDLYTMADGARTPQSLSGQADYLPYLSYGRGGQVAATSYNREVSDDGWNSGPLSTASCSNNSSDASTGTGDYILTTALVDQFGRPMYSLTNIVEGDDFAALYRKQYIYDDAANFVELYYPSDNVGGSDSYGIRYSQDRLGRPYLMERIRPNGSTDTLWKATTSSYQIGTLHSQTFGYTANADNEATWIERTLSQNFYGQITEIVHQDQAGNVLLKEEMGYANQINTAGTDANATCGDLGYRQWGYGQIGWSRMSGSAWFDSVGGEIGESLTSDERCYFYSGAGHLTYSTRMVTAAADLAKFDQTKKFPLWTEYYVTDKNGNPTEVQTTKYQQVVDGAIETSCSMDGFWMTETNEVSGAEYGVSCATTDAGKGATQNPEAAGVADKSVTSSFDYDETYSSLDGFTTAAGSPVKIVRDAGGFRPVSITTDAGSYGFKSSPAGVRLVETHTDAATDQTTRSDLLYGGQYAPEAEFSYEDGKTSAAEVRYNLPTGAQINSSSGQIMMPIRDRLGSTRVLMSSGEVVAQFDYGTRGQPVESDTCSGDCDARDYRYLYQGHRYLPLEQTASGYTDGLHDFGARLYSHDQGRFLNTDLVADGFSPYVAMKSDWINYGDLDGRAGLLWWLISVGGMITSFASIGSFYRAPNAGGPASLAVIRNPANVLRIAFSHYPGVWTIASMFETIDLFAGDQVLSGETRAEIGQWTLTTNAVLFEGFQSFPQANRALGAGAVVIPYPSFTNWRLVSLYITIKAVLTLIVANSILLGSSGTTMAAMMLTTGDVTYTYVRIFHSRRTLRRRLVRVAQLQRALEYYRIQSVRAMVGVPPPFAPVFNDGHGVNSVRVMDTRMFGLIRGVAGGALAGFATRTLFQFFGSRSSWGFMFRSVGVRSTIGELGFTIVAETSIFTGRATTSNLMVRFLRFVFKTTGASEALSGLDSQIRDLEAAPRGRNNLVLETQNSIEYHPLGGSAADDMGNAGAIRQQDSDNLIDAPSGLVPQVEDEDTDDEDYTPSPSESPVNLSDFGPEE